MIKLRCIIERITYQNPENGYTVLKARVKGYRDLVAVVGNLFDVNVGSVLLVDGDWKVDSKYGRQFMAQKWEETLPATVYGIEKYLGSGLIQGIGPKFAKRIVQEFGTDTIEVIENNSDKLFEVAGIVKKRVRMIQESWEQQKEIKNVMLFLQNHDINTSFAAKIYKQYGNDSIEKIKENPYCLADDIWGIGFRTADQIAERMGFAKESYRRLRSGLRYTLSSLAEDGHVYAKVEQMISKAESLLEVEEAYLIMTMDQNLKDKDFISDQDAIYLPPFYYAEIGTANRLLQLAEEPASGKMPKQIDITRIEQAVHMQYDTVQKQAIHQAAESKVMVLSGGPGTGKTTTTKGIIAAYLAYGLKILLAAPTGRAAKRMSEATGMEAKIIHRLLECKPPEGYQKKEDNPLEGDVLIVDECSMIDIILMNALLKAIPKGMRLILIGDIDQLPSVGAGNVLRDIMESGCFPVIRLTRIFRQAQTSRIIMNAHRINSGYLPDISNGKASDFFFIEKETPEKILMEVVDLVKSRLSRYYKIPSSLIQVLTPMQRGVIGSINLNLAMQESLNPERIGLRHRGFLFRQKDKVMQIKNNYDKEVFNGNIGVIEYVNLENRTLTVTFDGRSVEYEVSQLDELVLAYAITIHKSQGSEYPIIVMPISMSHYKMLQRNLLYTGITRAKQILVLVGTKEALSYAVNNVIVTKRNTMLRERLMEKMM